MSKKTASRLGAAVLVALGLVLPLPAEEEPATAETLEVIYYYLPG